MLVGFKALREAIITKVNSAITDGSIKHIGEICYSPEDISTMPTSFIFPESLESSYENTAGGRRRLFVFRVFIMQSLENEKQTDVEKLLEEAVDELIDLFDKKNALSVEGLLHIRPVPSVWSFGEYNGGDVRLATMTLECEVIVDET